MGTSKLVSVIIPAYNHEQYVQDAIQSVINQTYPTIELVVLNDGSKDSTWEKILEMREVCEARFVNVIFETQENKGTCLTLNKLIELSTGEYIQLLASDDKLSNQATQILYDFLSTSPDYALAVGKNKIIDSNGTVCYWNKKRERVYEVDKAKYLSFSDFLSGNGKGRVDFNSAKFGDYETLLLGNYIPNGYLIRKSIFDKIGYFTPQAPLEDYWLMLQIAKYAKFKFINQTTFYYRWHSSNTSIQLAKMHAITKQTLDYEIKCVSLSGNEKFKQIVNGYINVGYKIKSYFKIPYVLEIYKRIAKDKTEKVINFLGYVWVMKSSLKK